jgi:hypothetical protein
LESDILAGKSRTEEKFPLPAGPFRKVCWTEKLKKKSVMVNVCT